MKIILSRPAGFCAGVQRAYDLIKNNYARTQKPVYILGRLVHNTHIIRRLKKWGIKTISNPYGIKKGTVIIPSHGFDPKITALLKSKKIKIINTTCPKVSQVMAKARLLKKQSKTILIFGDKSHPEVKAINQAVNNQGLVFSNIKELQTFLNTKIAKNQRLSLISQTTQNIDHLKRIKEILSAKTPGVQVFNTICPATHIRQNQAKKLAKKADVMLVIGSPISANSNRLFQICKKNNSRAFFVDKAAQIKKQWFNAKDVVGISTGASTPQNIIKQIIKKLKTCKSS
ncbi:MAG: 4-hydroxy-3-methylbut-2-enyl diphosphate reductase [Patescibacteria group bacterium]|nr:4-hydroxy-3-methylbut-2-enyl diphosphate reductase [Patescibacteria group bacterium]